MVWQSGRYSTGLFLYALKRLGIYVCVVCLYNFKLACSFSDSTKSLYSFASFIPDLISSDMHWLIF